MILFCYCNVILQIPSLRFDGSGHKTPCAPVNTISQMRKDIFAETPLSVFKLRLNKNDGTMMYLDMHTGQFEELADGKLLLSSATDGYFHSKRSEFYDILSYDATSFKRVSFVVAVMTDNGFWYARLRCVLSTTNGLLLFKTRSIMQKGEW